MSLDDDKIEELATAPQKTRTEEGTVEERPIDDLIKADQYIKQNQAIGGVPWGMRIAKVSPSGTCGRY